MKTVIGLFTSIAIASASTLSPFDNDDNGSSVLESTNSGPVLIDHGAADSNWPQETVLEKPAIQYPSDSAPGLPLPYTDDLLIVDDFPVPMIDSYPSPNLSATVCTTCTATPCCCKSKRCTVAQFDLVDPNGCLHTACIKVPVCCLNETPSVSWKVRLLGRQVATICWECCNHEVKVVITRRGKVRVRD